MTKVQGCKSGIWHRKNGNKVLEHWVPIKPCESSHDREFRPGKTTDFLPYFNVACDRGSRLLQNWKFRATIRDLSTPFWSRTQSNYHQLLATKQLSLHFVAKVRIVFGLPKNKPANMLLVCTNIGSKCFGALFKHVSILHDQPTNSRENVRYFEIVLSFV